MRFTTAELLFILNDLVILTSVSITRGQWGVEEGLILCLLGLVLSLGP